MLDDCFKLSWIMTCRTPLGDDEAPSAAVPT